ncbi:MAG: NUDIX domain-containing protein [Pseudomonadota bacterium]
MTLPEEEFEVFDHAGVLLGLQARSTVHRVGLWHRSSQVFVFDDQGRLLLQRRVAHKDLYPNLWDYSVGEHLQPGESHHEGALRGLREELSICGCELSPLGDIYRTELRGETFCDREIQQAFSCTYSGPVEPEPEEVAQVRFVTRPALAAWLDSRPEEFTPWFRSALERFQLLD